MFGSIGGPELIVIFVVALLIFGPRKLPELGRMLGKGLSEFRRAASDLKESLEVEVAREVSSDSGGRPVSSHPSAIPHALPAPPADSGDAPAPPAAGAPDERGPEEPL